MIPTVLMRSSLSELDEELIASNLMRVIKQRTDIEKNDLVIPRYSLLPYARELEIDVINMGAKLINTTAEHTYVANIENWYADFSKLTPKTWFQLQDLIIEKIDCPLVFKGKTNSRKANWRTHMFASSKESRRGVIDKLLDDPLISDQGIIARQFENFQTFDDIVTGINGLPVTNEWRSFILDGKVITTGFYWSEHYEEILEERRHELTASSEEASEFVSAMIAPLLKARIRFCVADVARAADGRWRLVELNDGSMSGLSCCNINSLYEALSKLVV